MKILCCVFSWKGQFERAVKLQEQLSPLLDVVVINSDDDNTKAGWIDIGNECYFSDQFRTALNLFDSSKYDALWHIQADASYDDWKPILDSAISTFNEYNWGVYAPNVNDTFYVSERTDVYPLTEKLTVVGTTDNTCWFVHKDFIDEMIERYYLMDSNILGWGWDLIICGLSHIKNRLVIRDYSYTVNHPASTGYLKDQAEQEMVEMFHKCDEKLQEVIYNIKLNPSLLNKKQLANSQEFIYNTNVRYY